MTRIALIFLFFLVSYSFSFSQNVKETDIIPLAPAMRYGKLVNGFTYYIKKTDISDGTIEMRFVVKAGRHNEDSDQLGLAHMTEHMAFNGTKNFPGRTMVEFFRNAGLKNGKGTWGANTQGSVTKYRLTIPANDKEFFNNCLKVIRDWAQELLFTPEEIDSERGVVLAEIKNGEDKESRLMGQITSDLLEHPKYTLKERSSEENNIAKFKHESLIRFYNDWYRPSLEAVIIVGDVQPDEVKKQIELMFASLKEPSTLRVIDDASLSFSVPLTGKNKFLAYQREKSGALIQLFYKKENTGAVNDISEFKAASCEKLLNEMLRIRMTHINSDTTLNFKSITTRIDKRAIHSEANLQALYTMILLDDGQSVEKGFKAAMMELERVRRFGFNPSEFIEAKEKVFGVKNKLTTAELANMYVDHFSNGSIAPQQEFVIKLTKRIEEEIKINDVANLFKSWMGKETDRDIVFINSPGFAYQIPDSSTISQWLKEVQSVKLLPYVEPKKKIEFLIEPEEMASSSKITVIDSKLDELGVTTVLLSTGAKLIFKPCQSNSDRGNRINIIGYNSINTPDGENRNFFGSRYACSIATNAGAGKFDKVELESYIKQWNIQLATGISEKTASIVASCNMKDLEKLLQVIYLKVSKPKSDSTTFNSWKVDQLKKIDKHNISSFESIVSSFRYALSGNALPSTIEKVDFNGANRIYKTYFSGKQSFIFIITGDIEVSKSLPVIIKYLSPLLSGKANIVLESSLSYKLKGKVSKTVYSGSNRFAEVQLYFPGVYQSNLKNEFLLNLLAKILRIKMSERLREKEGGTYSVNTNIIYSATNPGVYQFSILFKCDTSKREYLIASVLDVVRELQKSGVDSNSLQTMLKSLIENEKSFLNGSFCSLQHLVKPYIEGKNAYQVALDRLEILNNLTTNDLMIAANQYLSDSNFMRFIQLPEKNKN